MIPMLGCALLLAAYLWMYRAYHRNYADKPRARQRMLYVIGGCIALALSLSPWLDALSDRFFAWHMAQHLGLIMIGPPLLLLGAPWLYLMGTLPRSAARALSAVLRSQPLGTLFSPVSSWLLFVAVLWASHFSALYNAALELPAVHGFEHALYFTAALLFWSNVVQTGFVPHPLAFPARMLYLFLAIPQGAFLGLALYQTRAPLYPHYAAGRTLAATLGDQHNGGALMWICGGLLFFAAFMLTAAVWAARERSGAPGYTALCALFAMLLTAGTARAHDLNEGARLFITRCASCHGLRLQGSNLGPPLLGKSAADVHFMLDTGRMPTEVPWVQQLHRPPAFSTKQINNIVAYVGTLSGSKDQALPIVSDGSAIRGRPLYEENCQQCHGPGGNGGALGYGRDVVAPPLTNSSPLQVAEAMRVGPGEMPKFGTDVLTNRDVDDVARYVGSLQTQRFNPGGIALSDEGPVPEGFVAWVFGLGLLIVLIRRLGTAT